MNCPAKVILSVVFLSEHTLKDAAGTLFCASPQYIILGEKGILECSFPNQFHTIAWYDSPNTAEALVTKIEIQDDGTLEVSGDGYESGAYDICLNGSLIIPSVTTYHDRTFKVVLVDKSLRVSIRDIDSTTIDAAGTLFCASPQYIILGEKGILECSFPNQFHTIAWYDSPNTTEALVTKIEMQDDGTLEVSGDGYESGAYDICLNGSLIIPSVTTYHDRTFKVVLIDKSFRVSFRDIDSTTIVHPLQTTAAVNLCGADDHCFVNSMETDILNCTYTGARPTVELTWYNNNREEILHVGRASFSDGNYTFTSISFLDISGFTQRPLIVFTCEASGPALNFKNITTTVFVYNIQNAIESHYANVTERNVILNSTLIISCTDLRLPTVLVWSFKRTDTTSILLTSSDGKTEVSDNMNDSFEVSKDGALHFRQVDYSIEGLFTCIYLEYDVSSLNMVRVIIIDDQDETDETFSTTVVVIVVIVLITTLVGLLCCASFFLRKQKIKQECDLVGSNVSRNTCSVLMEESPNSEEETKDRTNISCDSEEESDDEYYDVDEYNDAWNVNPKSAKMLPLQSSSTEEENYANEKKASADDSRDSPKELPWHPYKADTRANFSLEPSICHWGNHHSTGGTTTATDNDAPGSRTAIGAALSKWRLKVDHEDKQVDSIEELAKGDHIVFSGWALHPRCHGIVVDTNIESSKIRLVRFTYQKGVVEEWKKWKPPIYKVTRYYIGDKSISSKLIDADVVINRARSRINNERLTYNIRSNNCKTFARWCKTGATPAGEFGYD